MESLESVVREAARAHRHIYFRTQFGNAGDALINAGFYCLADRLGLRYRELRGDSFVLPPATRDDLVILTGGGSLSEHWDSGANALAHFTQQEAPLLILPSSLNGNEDVLRLLRPIDTLILRDAYSAQFARSLELRARLLLTDDTAFSVDVERLLAISPWRAPRRSDDLRRAAAFAQHRLRAARGETLYAWRLDEESVRDTSAFRRRDDISQLADFGTMDRASSCYSAQWMLRIARWYERVETDRLHFAIACVLAGTPVTLHPNDHHKIVGVYELSLAPHPARSRLARFAGNLPSATV
ncbi:polysaccharide pyruvyl transferase family protein [Paracoccus sp. (in: a-proteobacteria)]|uniref:polysaccharide pyruvyl transferase family protein n=1 Tax=Paracoccus sp. TaxID=267 RepID=UPI0032206280